MLDLIDFHSMGRVNKYLEAYATMPNKEKFHFWKMTKDEFKWYIQYLKEYEDKLFLRDYRILHVGDADHNDFVLDYECDNIFEALDSHFIVKKQMQFLHLMLN